MAGNWVLHLLFVLCSLCFLNAQNTDYSFAEPPTTWINNDFSLNGSTKFADGSIVRPILLNNSDTFNFPDIGCGFYGNQSTDSFYFAIYAVQATGDFTFDTTSSPVVIWTANRANPVKENATLDFTSDGDLVLKDADGMLTWSSNTSSLSVAWMNVTKNGTLLMGDVYGFPRWQSDPAYTWLPVQELVPGQRLIASSSASNWTPGLFYLSFVKNDLFAFIQSDPPQIYRKVFSEDSKPKQFKTGSLDLVTSSRGTSVSVRYRSRGGFQYLRLDSDGHLRVYTWDEGMVKAVDDILTDSLGDCAYPTVCGNYGICSPNGPCTCPVGSNGDASFFRKLNSSLGCIESTRISCESIHLHDLLELDEVSYSGFTTVLANVDIERCKEACLKNCSCKAALFRYNLNTLSGNCSLPSKIFSLMRIPQGVVPYNSSSFIKVQKPSGSLAPHPSVAPPPNPSAAQSPNTSNKRKHTPESPRKRIALILGLIFAAVVLIFLTVWICVRVVRKQTNLVAEGRKNSLNENSENSLNMLQDLPTRFTYKDLQTATGNFHKRLGGGGFGSVFEGMLSNGTKIAVKLLDRLGQGRKEFLAEVKTVGTIHHVNLVRLIGFCAEKSHKLLVYEYMSNGSLDKWIFSGTPETSLEWEIRKKIILNIAKGLAYLHEDCRMRIAHLDIKPQNILLDENFNAKLSDFGLARLIDRNQSQVLTQMRGTRGYMAPEWLSRKITEKVDVYSFGVVVLEVVCGRKNLDFSQPEEDDYVLLHMVKEKAEDNQLFDLVDKCSEDMQQHGEEAVEMMRVAIWCLHNDSTRRPSMSKVVKVLEGVMVMEPISDYGFLTSTIVEAPTEAVVIDSTPPPASILSGPR